MLTAHQRIERQKSSPALVRLHQALSRLRSTVTLMHTGAHPDDEQSGLLAYMRFGLGMQVVIACSTRGEGGQNALGPERGGALGVIRSREMEEAARILDCDVHWLGHGPDDSVHDFGFSKDGDGTFAHWGEEKTVERLVRAYRTERPDIVLPTFLDVPGQHGHHRAMTQAAETAIRLAADPTAFPEHFSEGLMPWQVAKFYLPAWSGGGDTYDDELPPPDTTLTVHAAGRDAAIGADYDRIGEWSRACHATQGMGRWPEAPKVEWPLHLKLPESHSETTILDGLPETLATLAEINGLTLESRKQLLDAHLSVEGAIAAFPNREAIIKNLVEAAKRLKAVLASAPEDFLLQHRHRLERKLREIDAALIEAASLFERAYLDEPVLAAGSETRLVVEYGPGTTAIAVSAEPVLPETCSIFCEEEAPEREILTISLAKDTAPSPLFEPVWRSIAGNGQACIRLKAQFEGHLAERSFDLEEPLAIVPPVSLKIAPPAVILSGEHDPLPIQLMVNGPAKRITFASQKGWEVGVNGLSTVLYPPSDPTPGLTCLQALVDGTPAWQTHAANYPHIGKTVWREPAMLPVLTLDVKLPDARIGYIGGGADNVGLWLKRMGLDVTDIEPHHLAGDLSGFTTIVVGIFAFGLRNDLAAATTKLHRFVEDGGHLVTLYHRPSDGWHPDRTPPRKLTIGSPSLRWRVTNPHAAVTVLEPEHPLLVSPNMISERDWNDWHKERGLYFASAWDDAYQPLLSMHDDGEQPLYGSLVSGRIGKGRHTHTSLALHHQLDKLVPGAFRLMANLVQAA
ncbi:PIG-L family deacetylase [Brucella pecoris]|uniref:LmbE family N-acetylglucosaminyl deacetylase n=1 Tax=Brucella pecoris TaxID=867683 RepID=A0A5C5CVD7_9HYPH|nr:PIG-L family deacetylase [Brucella pecoris]MBB4092818.1 LmbE family N-acetylglucosaminyl deacetylase [Brucella pecoris]TNV14626.1 PIG-L family deacetylase [Brucella pecoris]